MPRHRSSQAAHAAAHGREASTPLSPNPRNFLERKAGGRPNDVQGTALPNEFCESHYTCPKLYRQPRMRAYASSVFVFFSGNRAFPVDLVVRSRSPPTVATLSHSIFILVGVPPHGYPSPCSPFFWRALHASNLSRCIGYSVCSCLSLYRSLAMSR